MIKNIFLNDKEFYPDKTNARISKNKLGFKMINMPLTSQKGMELNAPIFVRKELINP